MPLLFVYGTLQRGCRNHCELAAQHFLCPARTRPGWALHDLGAYPGIVPDPADHDGVPGELWEVSPDALQRLDAFEGVPEGLYERRGIELALPAGTSAETYVYARPIAGYPRLARGWTEHEGQ